MLPLLRLCCSLCCAKRPSRAVGFICFLSNIMYMQCNGPVCMWKTGQVAKVTPLPLISYCSYYTCFQSHLENPENLTVPIILLAHSSACLLAARPATMPHLDLVSSPPTSKSHFILHQLCPKLPQDPFLPRNLISHLPGLGQIQKGHPFPPPTSTPPNIDSLLWRKEWEKYIFYHTETL